TRWPRDWSSDVCSSDLVGKKNSTVEELEAFVEGFNEVFRAKVGEKRGLSKISVNTGSSHGGVVLPDGTIAKVAIDFDTLREMSRSEERRVGKEGRSRVL